MTPNETGVEKWLLLLLRLQELTLNDHFRGRSLLAAAAICFLALLSCCKLRAPGFGGEDLPFRPTASKVA